MHFGVRGVESDRDMKLVRISVSTYAIVAQHFIRYRMETNQATSQLSQASSSTVMDEPECEIASPSKVWNLHNL